MTLRHLYELKKRGNQELDCDVLYRHCLNGDSTCASIVDENDHVIAAGGIVDIGWNRGEAWIVVDSSRLSGVRRAIRIIRESYQSMAKRFRRVQAVCYCDSDVLIRHLGLEYEATLRAYGPNGEDGRIYARVS